MKFAVGFVVLSLFCIQSWANVLKENESRSGMLETRIVNGRKARVNEFPWQVYLERNGHFICGGSIIRRDWILTAAHCVRKQPFANRYRVTVGAQARRGRISAYKKTYRVKKLIYHHHYFRRHIRYDVALLQLDSSVKISKGVQIISLPRRNTRARIGQKCYTTGWGRLGGGKRIPNILRVADIRIAHFNHCRKKNGPLVHDPTMVCAGAQGKGSCNGDSGGPLSCKENNRFVLRGVTSWGIRGCLTNRFSVFARVSSFLGWINKVTSGSGGCKKIKCLNGGKSYCHGKVAKCRCKPYYAGPRCGKRLCPNVHGGCFHGKVRCINRFYSYCHCNRGYTGVNCEIRRTSCPPIYCLSRGSPRCLRGVFYSWCKCRAGFAGRFCQYNKGWF